MTGRPDRKTGLAHLLAATRYSLAGLRRMLAEPAFRHELAFGAAGLALLAGLGAGPAQIAVFAGLLLVLLAVEALNTAIEVVVDHLSPDWSEFARDAKDLGSFAVMCLIGVNLLGLGLLILW